MSTGTGSTFGSPSFFTLNPTVGIHSLVHTKLLEPTKNVCAINWPLLLHHYDFLHVLCFLFFSQHIICNNYPHHIFSSSFQSSVSLLDKWFDFQFVYKMGKRHENCTPSSSPFLFLLINYSCPHFSPLLSPALPTSPTFNPPPPLVLVHGSFIPFPFFPPLAPSPHPLVTVSLFFISMSVVLFCLLDCFVD